MNSQGRAGINVIGAGCFILIGAGAAAVAGPGIIAALMALVALLCGLAGWRMLTAARKQSSG